MFTSFIIQSDACYQVNEAVIVPGGNLLHLFIFFPHKICTIVFLFIYFVMSFPILRVENPRALKWLWWGESETIESCFIQSYHFSSNRLKVAGKY